MKNKTACQSVTFWCRYWSRSWSWSWSQNGLETGSWPFWSQKRSRDPVSSLSAVCSTCWPYEELKSFGLGSNSILMKEIRKSHNFKWIDWRHLLNFSIVRKYPKYSDYLKKKTIVWNHVWEILLSWWWWGCKVLSDNKCAAEMGVMPLLRLLPMIVIAPFCSRSQRYKLAFLYLSYKLKIQYFFCCQSILSFGQNCEFLFETFCFSDRAEKFIWANKSHLGCPPAICIISLST